MSFLNGRLTVVLVPVLAGLALAAAPRAARADTPALKYLVASVTPGFSSVPQTLGWQFTTLDPISVDALGYFDFGADGLNGPHDVGIWNSAGTLLTSATVDTTDPIEGPPADDGAFRYETITPLSLPAGMTYTIGGTAFNPDSTDAWEGELNPTPLNDSPAIFIPDSGVLVNAAGLTEPTTPGNVDAYAGPNFLIGSPTSEVPEPGSLALLLTGMLPLAGSLRRRRA